MHAKSENDAKRNGTCCSKKVKESEGKAKWVQEEGDQENKRPNKKANEKRGECETWWTKTRSDEKRTEEKLVRKRNTKKSKEIHFLNTEEFLKQQKIKKGDITNP